MRHLTLVVAWFLVGGTLPAAGQGIGGASARLGFARDADGGLGSGSLAGEVRLAFLWGDFEMGPKVGYARLGSDTSVWEPGVLARLRFGSGRWRPTVHGALSGLIYGTEAPAPVGTGSFRDVDGYFGGELGAGAVLVRSGGPDVGLEVSVHKILQHTGGFDPGAFWTATVGIDTHW